MALPLLAAIPAIMPVIGKILDLFPDGDAKAKAEAELQRALLDATMKEAADNREILKTEAAHTSLFVAGPRPFILWICGISLAFAGIVRPVWVWVSAIWFPEAPLPPEIGSEELTALTFSLLGLGGYRTVEKLKGKAR